MDLKCTGAGAPSGGSVAVTNRGDQLAMFSPKESQQNAIAITPRDLELLGFIAEMKFANAEHVFQKFFRRKRDNTESTSLAWTQKRLLQLERAGYLHTEVIHTEGARYYLTSRKGFRALEMVSPESTFVRPARTIDVRTFVHDRLVLEARLEFEAQDPNCRWISERQLKARLFGSFGMTAAQVPDSVYQQSIGPKVAFEMEIAQKARSRYRDKLEEYARLLRERANEPEMFRKVHFRCVKKAVFEAISAEAFMYGDLFQVELWTPKQNVQGA